MADFETRVEGLTGLSIDGGSSPTQNELTEYLKDGVIEITNRIITLMPSEVENFQKVTTTDSQGVDIGRSKVLSVLREAGVDGSSDGSTAWRVCRKIPAALQSRVSDENSLEYASIYNPVYTIENGVINIYPRPSANNGMKIYHVNINPVNGSDGALVYSNDTINYFPVDKIYLVILYAGIKSLQNALSSKIGDLPSNLLAPTMPSRPVAPIMSEKSMTITGTAPVYEYQTYALPDINISDLNITTTPPLTPVLTSNTVSFTASVPTYTAPVFSLDADVTKSDLTITTDIPQVPVLTNSTVDTSNFNLPTYSPPPAPSLDFADAGSNWINTEEDPEMSSARVNVINAQIQDYSAKIQDEVQRFNKDSLIYQQEVNVAIQDSNMSSNADAQKLQDYSNQVQKYTQQVNAQVQEYTTNLNKDLQIYSASTNAKQAKYSADMQNETNKFNKEMQVYQAELQVALQNAELAGTDDSLALQKFQSEVQDYVNQVNTEVQEYNQNFQKEFQIWQTKCQNELTGYQSKLQNALNDFNEANTQYQAIIQKDLQDSQLKESKETRDLQKYASEIQDYSANTSALLQKFSANIQNYSAKLQKVQLDYGWMETRMMKLQQEYDGAFGLMAPQQQQGEK
tara:strand:- start:3477 stop:5357 length:1881 start_codon:yes stop_codon:yes gene_type:complete